MPKMKNSRSFLFQELDISMERFDYQHLDGFTIEADKGAIRIDYSEPDQGGTQLLIRFRIFLNGRMEQESGYTFDRELRVKEIGRDNLPARVVTDVMTWIQEQKEIGRGNLKLLGILDRIEAALNS